MHFFIFDEVEKSLKSEGVPPLPAGFHLAMRTDVPAGETEPCSHPGQVIWEGDNDDRNPVAAGIYLYLIEGNGGPYKGKLAIKRARKQ